MDTSLTIAVDLNLQADTEISTLRSLVELAVTTGKVLDKNRLAEDAADTTLIHRPGQHVCAAVFPVLTEGVSDLIIAFGRARGDISYFCTRNEPIDLMILVAAPSEQGEQYFPLFWNLRRFLSKDENRRRLREAERIEEVENIFLSVVKPQC